jgi:hypothetical protein
MDLRLEEAKEYLALAQRALDRRMIGNALTYCREAEARLLSAQVASPGESLSGDKSFENSLPVADYMRLRRAGGA